MAGQQLPESVAYRGLLSGFQAALDAWRLGQPGIPSRDDSLWRLALYPEDIEILLRIEDLEDAVTEFERLVDTADFTN